MTIMFMMGEIGIGVLAKKISNENSVINYYRTFDVVLCLKEKLVHQKKIIILSGQMIGTCLDKDNLNYQLVLFKKIDREDLRVYQEDNFFKERDNLIGEYYYMVDNNYFKKIGNRELIDRFENKEEEQDKIIYLSKYRKK